MFGGLPHAGFKAVASRASVHDLHATMLRPPGFDHERLTYRHAGRDFRLTDVSGGVMREIVAQPFRSFDRRKSPFEPRRGCASLSA